MSTFRDRLDARVFSLGAIVGILLGLGFILAFEAAVVTTLGAIVIILGMISFMLAFGVYLDDGEAVAAG